MRLVEKLNVKLCKYVLGVGKHATNAAVTGEVGRYPIALKLIRHSYNYWNRLNALPENSIVRNSHIDSLLIEKHSPSERNWSTCMRHILSKFDQNLDWGKQICYLSPHELQSCMCSDYEELWLNFINKPNHNKLRTYAQSKKKFSMENYVLWKSVHTSVTLAENGKG